MSGHGHGHGHGHSPGRSGWWARLRHAVVPHAHDHHDAIRTAEESSRLGIRAAWIGLAGMTATALAQVLIVAVSGSVALLADTIHNVGHAATTIPLILAFRLGMRRPDERYSYGYRRAEDLVGLFIGLVVLVSAAWVLWESVSALLDPRPLANLGWVLAAGLVGAAGNEAVAVQRIRAGRRIGSAALVAEGQHARADGLTSLAVVGGVLGVYAGFPRADAVVGLVIGVSIVGILVASMRPVVRRLMDGVEPGVLAAMRATALAEEEVRGVDRVRARWAGHRLEGDATIRVDGGLSVTAAHAVAERVEHALLHVVDHLDAVVVHVHPDIHDHADLHPLTSHHA
ncbi:cation diffusion facilitator family transporter [Nocardioides sp. CFH 31398]|uniref:cation diffusion facilitator family transporter n=1 Tax=Nocardioides sp. CFH 31398 TaxID=2919579 RepID=UPI001F05DD46|nr:cation diffusion facilitator family transporter [Nocardioides sp. CFH 31398]MCH1865449.1 cation diffusion facilitator family transporter [Nocardioides sp. CFH 31398]